MKKWPFFAIILLWMASYGSGTSFLLIFSARDDLVKVSWKSDARKYQNKPSLLTLTSWVKGTSPFLLLQVGTFATNINSGQFFLWTGTHRRLSTLEAKKIKQRQSRWNKSFSLLDPGWQKLCRGTGAPRQKVWTWTLILSPNIRYIVAN